MFKNYFKVAWRHLAKNKLYTFVNILGLTAGIISCVLIGIYILDELSFDKFNVKAGRIVRVTTEYNMGDQVEKIAVTGTKIGPQFKRTFPQVQAYVRIFKDARVVAYGEKMFDEKNFLFADSAFFTVFSFPLLSGDPKSVLDAPDKIVLTQSAAKKYFPNGEAIGKSIQVAGKNFIISGIAKNVPTNSQIDFDFVAPFLSLPWVQTEKWFEANFITYLLIQNQDQLNHLQGQIADYMKYITKNELKAEPNQYLTFHLELLTKVHLYSDLEGFEPNGNIIYIYILAIVAVLILLIACVNYTNLSVAQSSGRSMEVGIRKVMGAGMREIFSQFIAESIILASLTVLIAYGLSYILLPYFNQLSGKQLHAGILLRPLVIASLIGLSAFIAFAAGVYPSFIVSKEKIIGILKSGLRLTGSNSIRRSLIVFQFVISIFLIIATIVILQQISYIHNKNLGYDKDHVLVLPLDGKILAHYDDFKNAMSINPGVVSITAGYTSPTDIQWTDGIQKGTGRNENSITVNAIPVDLDFVKTLNLKIIAGSDFTVADTSSNKNNPHYAYILNESAIKALGWSPQEAIGKTIQKGVSGIVKAVVKDFHFRSFHEPINPLVIFLGREFLHQMFIKISGPNLSNTLSNLEKTWKERVAHRPFEYHFLDEDYNNLYLKERRTAGVFTTFSGLAILLACLGLFALTAYSMVQRTKEIGIRKILGATIPDILVLVSKDFMKLIGIALVIASPIALYAVNKWLMNFSYRINISWWVFATAGITTLLIAFITISSQAIKTALTNPVKNLRTE